MVNIVKKEYASIGKKQMTYRMKSYLESLKYQKGGKGKRVLHDFHDVNITLLYEPSMKSIHQCTSKE